MNTYTLDSTKLEVLQDQVLEGSQGWRREVTVRWRTFVFRVKIVRDAYEAQSMSTLEVFSQASLQWNVVRVIPAYGTDLLITKTRLKFFTSQQEPFKLTQAIVNELLAYGQQLMPR